MQEIGAGAFSSCFKLQTVYLPLSLKKVGNWAFGSCYALSYAKYAGTQTQWTANVTVGSGNSYLTNNLNYSTATHVSHPICGEGCDCEDGSHGTGSWTSWNGTSSLGQGGCYYLTQDIDRETLYTIYGSVVICLNGHTITTNGQASGLEVTSTGNLTICDCSGTGGLHSDDGDTGFSTNEIGIENAGALKIYGGSFHGAYCGIYNTGTVTVYDAEITAQEYGILNDTNGNVKVYGGIVTGDGSSVFNNETFLLDGGTMRGKEFLNFGNLIFNSGYIRGHGPYNDNYDGVTNYGTMTMTGGYILPYRLGIALENRGTLHFSAGTLSVGITTANGVRHTVTGLWNSSKDSICYLSGTASPGCVHLYYPNTLILTDQTGTQAYTGEGFKLRIEPYYFTSGTAIRPVTAAQAETIVLYNDAGDPSEESGHLKHENNKLTFTPHTTEYVASVSPTCTKTAACDFACGTQDTLPDEDSAKGHSWKNGRCTVCGTIDPDAESGTCDENLIWILADGVLTISGEGAMDDYDYWDVFAPWFGMRADITEVVIRPGVTCVGRDAFSIMENITSVTLPDTITSIGDSAFDGCTGLTAINLPASLVSIGRHAFSACTGLTSAGPVGGDYNIQFGWTNKIPENAFYGCDSLTSITLPDTITGIGDFAFAFCYALPSVTP